MKVIVTCGPSYEPVDQVRRITNFSIGELGVRLCNELARAGFEVFCLKGSGAMHPGPSEQCHPVHQRRRAACIARATERRIGHLCVACFR